MKWIATCTLDEGNSTFPIIVEANTYGAAYVKVLCKLPARCALGSCADGILNLEAKNDENPASVEVN